MTEFTPLVLQPSAERCFIFFCVSVFALVERKNRNTDKMGGTMLPQAKKAFVHNTA
jgi:hypothetical protein